MSNLCKGCDIWTRKEDNSGLTPQCKFIPTINNINCPCIICLLKMICLKPCEEYLKYVKSLEIL